MIALPRQVTCQRIMAAAREHAWTDMHLVLGLPTRLGDEPTYTRHWDLTAIAEVLEQARALRWGLDELTAWDHDGTVYGFAIPRPGSNGADRPDQLTDYVVAGADLDEILHLAATGFTGAFIAGTTHRGKAMAWTMTGPVPSPACAHPHDQPSGGDR